MNGIRHRKLCHENKKTTKSGMNRTTKSGKIRTLEEKETNEFLEILEADIIEEVEMKEKI